MKKLLAGIGLTTLVLAGSLPIASANVKNVTDESDVSITSTNRLDLMLRKSNTAVITNNITAVATSGGNVIESEDDMEGVTLTTGNADTAIEVSNMANNSETTIEIESAMPTGSVENVDDESTVVIDHNNRETIDVEEENDARVTNNVPAVSDTGSNVITSPEDMENVTVRTGTATATTMVENIFNFSKTEIIRRMGR